MDKITISEINTAEALRYMGAGDSVPQGAFRDTVEESQRRLLECISPSYTYRVVPIEDISAESVTFAGITADSRDLSEMLSECHTVVLMCATLGAKADNLIRRLQTEDMAKAVAADALASAAVEQVCGKFDEMLAAKYPGSFFTMRFSPGYGDLPLEFQKTLLAVLDSARRTGITLNSSGLMSPMKSVSAICGMADKPLPQKISGCVRCKMKETCAFRKRGMRCGS